MTQKHSTKKALIASVLSLLLCVSMLVGTTFAWFTDSVSSSNNVIKSGNLDIDVQYTLDGAAWKDLNGANDLFQKDLWEPGHTEVVALKIENKGSLALKYTASMNITNEIIGKTKDNQDIVLSEILTVSTLSVDQAVAAATIEDAFEAEDGVTYDRVVAFKSANVIGNDDHLLPGDTRYIVVKVDMPETVGNEANHNGTDVPSIEFGINLLASQYTYEEDSFDDQYDKNAGYTRGKTNVGSYSLNVLSDGLAVYDDETNTYDITVATVSQSGYNATQGGKFYAGYTVKVADYDENATVSFDKNGTTVVWKLADEERDGFITNGVHQQWTSVGTVRAYHYDINGDGVTDFTVVNDVSGAKVEAADEDQVEKLLESGVSAVLTSDIDLTDTIDIPADATVNLDLNGKTITAAPTALWAIQNQGTLTVTGDGAIKGSYTALYSNGNLTIEGGTFTATDGFGVLIDNIYGTDDSVAVINGGIFSGLGVYNPTNVTINGGIFNVGRDPDGATDLISDKMTLFINPTFVGAPNNATVVLNGGTFNGDIYVYDDGITDTTFVNNGATITGSVLDNG